MQIDVQTAQNGHSHERFDCQLEILDRISRQVQLDDLIETRQVIWQLSNFIVAEVDLEWTENGKV